MPSRSEIESTILALCDQIPSISLDEMKEIKLMNRIDTKFIAHYSQLSEILQRALSRYRIQCIDGKSILPYNTLYFDTPDCDMYLQHHNRKLKRQKIRTRTYQSTNLTFLEIKNKNNKGRTKKVRVEIGSNEFESFGSNTDAQKLMNKWSNYPLESLRPTLHTGFKRITLVNNKKSERLTIDFNLCFENCITGEIKEEPNLLIIELKQEGLAYSPMREILSELRIKQFKISKYCIGTALTNSHIKQNRFKTKLHTIARMTEA